RRLASPLAPALLPLGIRAPVGRWCSASRKKDPQVLAVVLTPVVQLPMTVPADAASVPDDAVVIGVEAGGRHRAYLLEALYPSASHVINDLVGGKPITVAYCDMT